MTTVLKIIVDNHAAKGLAAEHGLSMLIESGGRRILFDAGQGDALENNSRQLGLDLKHIDALVLSHGHYDHTGAVDFVMQENPEVQVYAHPAIFSERYSIYPGKDAKDISMPSEERLIVGNLPDSQLNWVKAPTQIAPGVWLTGPIPRLHPLEDTGGPFFEDPEGQIPDPIADDMAMWIETKAGLVVVCGCCHSGIINTLGHILAASGSSRIRGIIGGLHLRNSSDERLHATVDVLRAYAPEFMVPCHCTGTLATDFFKQNLKTEIHPGYAGFELKTGEPS
ncbi:Ribonuclease [Pontiella desulfatans]|uniref:Ribonuclease n=1 Tax=Pontiella desulfatans TaxID=2750659 RepID=A0A6C2UC38_PONDE|nr:MBL fold metallo-hydrolase [Pontiella desulfatans]VGO16816.1 Ribonuclease [Pontiella desulfatans]